MKLALQALVAAAALSFAGAASAATLVIGNGLAPACFRAADEGRADNEALRECNLALSDEPLSQHDRAATTINRGIIFIHRRDARAALADFESASRIEPELGESYVNRGAALILLGEYATAIESINHGLELGAEDPHEAYFNRAIAYEQMGDLRSAYNDYRRAQELKPDWLAPRLELQRFTVRPGH